MCQARPSIPWGSDAVRSREFFLDLLFYHTRLMRYVIVELKAQAFKPG